MDQIINSKVYDLEGRTFEFANNCKKFIKTLPRTISNIEYCKQLVRSSSSVGANYIEANESLSKKDFIMRVKICRKEAKESTYWLRLVECDDLMIETNKLLIQESIELTKIFGSILEKDKA